MSFRFGRKRVSMTQIKAPTWGLNTLLVQIAIRSILKMYWFITFVHTIEKLFKNNKNALVIFEVVSKEM
jgi:hypothetical protein